ncbi:hypothetical protein PtA15_14A355 [Puccinia triticina]|uniref:Uncharacterized protein n=1 Tax=Puccinia triticina TaxID=208348 RepID=A0ABY7D238_9BASI|nr:uncharacterized protein PtA15_14A355 [Puccinia triticina]WAQ91471.1 hypothetical protein PtA15_14A355 [Puccinia triticina]
MGAVTRSAVCRSEPRLRRARGTRSHCTTLHYTFATPIYNGEVIYVALLGGTRSRTSEHQDDPLPGWAFAG